MAILLCALAAWGAQPADDPPADFSPGAAGGRPEYFVAPDGTPEGRGTRGAPWDLRSVLSVRHPVPPGSVVWLRGGTYRGPQVCKLSGEPGRPVILRAFPGERATIDAHVPGGEGKPSYLVEGRWVWSWGFEVTNSAPTRITRGGGWPPGRHEGMVLTGAHSKFINMVSHDNGQGCAFWRGAVDGELHGNLIFHNGWEGGRGSGHGIYTQNGQGTKRITDNLIFRQFGYGLHAYAERTAVEGYHVEGNVSFENGGLSRRPYDNMLFTCSGPLKRLTLVENYTYFPPGADAWSCRLDWGPDDEANEDVVVRGNTFVGGNAAAELWNWRKADFTENRLYAEAGYVARIVPAGAGYAWDRNRYHGSGRFGLGGEENLTWEGWRKSSGLDAGSTFTPGRPTGVWTFVRPNRYERGRAHVVVYNWDAKEAVEVDLGPARLAAGKPFEVRDAQDFFGRPVFEGTYDGRPVRLPMSGLAVAAPVGEVPRPPRHTAPEFAVFVALPR